MINISYSGKDEYVRCFKESEGSLRDSIVVKSLLDSYDETCVNIYQSGIKNAKNAGLTVDEFLAIHSYTSNFYKVFNAFKRGQTKVFKKEVKQFKKDIADCNDPDLKNEISGLSSELFILRMIIECKSIAISLQSGLDKLPSYKGVVVRGDIITDEEYKDISGDRFSTPTVLSCSKTDKDWKEWVFRKPTNDLEKHPAKIEITAVNGKNIAPFSASPHEGEIIFKPGTQFTSKSVSMMSTMVNKVKDQYYSIILEEKHEAAV